MGRAATNTNGLPLLVKGPPRANPVFLYSGRLPSLCDFPNEIRVHNRAADSSTGSIIIILRMAQR